MNQAAGRPPGAGNSVVVRPDGEREDQVPGTSMLGMAVFLASLTMLFLGSLAAFVVIRLKATSWRPADVDPPYAGLAVASVLVIGCSFAVQRGLGAIRRGDLPGLARMLSVTFGCASVYLLVQGWNWWQIHQDNLLYGTGNLYGFTFYMLTVLHALHVVGGIISLVVVLALARRGKYSWASHAAVRQNTLYWHFLGVVWAVLLGVLLVGS